MSLPHPLTHLGSGTLGSQRSHSLKYPSSPPRKCAHAFAIELLIRLLPSCQYIFDMLASSSKLTQVWRTCDPTLVCLMLSAGADTSHALGASGHLLRRESMGSPISEGEKEGAHRVLTPEEVHR